MLKLSLGSSKELIDKLGILVDRMSVNIELPSQDSLKLLAPDKSKDNIVKPMSYISSKLCNSAQRLLPNRKNSTLQFDHLKKLGVVLKRARYFITCNGKYYDLVKNFNDSFITENLIYLERKRFTYAKLCSNFSF